MFKFAVYYLFDKTLKVESTSVILGSDQFTQVASQPDLDDDANWIEIKWPTRKETNRMVPAKVLLFGDSYKELVSKKNLFLLGKDIWAKEESRGVRMKKKMCETDVVKPKTSQQAEQTRIKDAARDQVLQNLKTCLSQKRALDTQDHLYSSENESPQRVHGGKRAKINKAARRVLLPLASSLTSDDATSIGSPQRHDIFQDHASDEELGFSQAQRMLMDDNTGHGMAPGMNEIMSCLHDLPEMIKLMRECVECVRALMSSRETPSFAASSSSVDGEIEMHPLAGSTVTVSKRAFLRLNRSRMTIFAQELAVLVFTKEGLAQSTLTGKSRKGGPPKTQLDVDKVQAITDAVLLEFRQTTVSDVRAAIRRKCNNEQFSQRNTHHA
ncbi:uncharacterized protein LOC115556376 isoform X2 [Gadus morhua]|uniref:uncharacterized protein LOC115556376 isoform X2 n=1 Tax=Gadus morhua TaxID=8049 RepID=UPI0011B8367E|nr:uncharacterized protein LOC115556376 isoform X2 [Gadus morhua]